MDVEQRGDADEAQGELDDLKVQTPKETKDLKVLIDEKHERMLAKEEWYHGCLPYEDIVGLLKNGGDFLLRELEPEGDRMAMPCVTVKSSKILDYPVHCLNIASDRIYTIDGTNKNKDVMDLVKYHHATGTPVDEHVKLINPVPKQPWELTSDKITLVSKIGAGAFGEVWQGWLVTATGKPPVDVAIKVTKVSDENKAKMDEMHKEARLMRQYKHRNIVTFYGIVVKSLDSVMIVMEMIQGGGLDHHLQNNPNIDNKDKIGYAIDVALGLVYLHSKGCMHRDIACRNCLIDLKKNVVKISDFGLSKQAESYSIRPDEKLPIRWQAPEVITTRIYTMKCDVYSYAIFLWEVFNNGQKPFAGMDNKTVRENVSNPKFRPVIDPTWPVVVLRVMRTCWRGDPKRRPQMAQVARFLIHADPESLKPAQSVKMVADRKKATLRALSSLKQKSKIDREQLCSDKQGSLRRPRSKTKGRKVKSQR
ncbi:hypothetical protein RB195_002983 [Necator americanus]|uniref:Tyrosine-protein kinase n=1 Tax=Necator americanus TaxID=51031 RepID=A0ABR1DLJ6_NECAM